MGVTHREAVIFSAIFWLNCNRKDGIDYFGKSEPPFRQSEPPAEVGWICR
jgi:hypothetical protein